MSAPAESAVENWSLLADDSEIDNNGAVPKLQPSVDDPSDEERTLKYTHGHGIAIDPLLEFSLVSSYNVDHHQQYNNMLHNFVKGTSGCPSLSNGQQQSTIISSITSSPTLLGETTVPVEFATGDQGGLDSTVDDLLSQLHTNIGLVSTGGSIENLNFYDGDADVVIVDPPKPHIEAVEAEVVPVPAPPVVSNNLANIFVSSSSSSDSSSSSSSSSGDSNVSSGGVTGGSVSSTSIANPFILLFSFALVVAGILVLSLPIWIPFVVARRRRTHIGPLRKKTYPASKKKTSTSTKGNRRGPNQVNLPYGNYNAGPAMPHPEYHSTTIEDYYRSSDILDVKPYSALFGKLFPAYSNKVFSDPGPVKSKDLYGPLSNYFLKARRRTSNKGKSPKNDKRKHFLM